MDRPSEKWYQAAIEQVEREIDELMDERDKFKEELRKIYEEHTLYVFFEIKKILTELETFDIVIYLNNYTWEAFHEANSMYKLNIDLNKTLLGKPVKRLDMTEPFLVAVRSIEVT